MWKQHSEYKSKSDRRDNFQNHPQLQTPRGEKFSDVEMTLKVQRLPDYILNLGHWHRWAFKKKKKPANHQKEPCTVYILIYVRIENRSQGRSFKINLTFNAE